MTRVRASLICPHATNRKVTVTLDCGRQVVWLKAFAPSPKDMQPVWCQYHAALANIVAIVPLPKES